MPFTSWHSTFNIEWQLIATYIRIILWIAFEPFREESVENILSCNRTINHLQELGSCFLVAHITVCLVDQNKCEKSVQVSTKWNDEE